LFDANHIILDKDVLCLRKSKEQEKIDEKEATVSKAIQRYHLLKEAYLKVVNSSTDEKEFKGTHFKAVINDRELCNEGKEYLEVVERLLAPVLAMVQLASACEGHTEGV